MLLLAGSSGGGKSTLSTGLLERLNEKQFQYCVIDLEGDYEGTDETISIGSAEQALSAGSVMELLRKTGNNVVVN
jgi:adenylylsulfate kinase-like enzyme